MGSSLFDLFLSKMFFDFVELFVCHLFPVGQSQIYLEPFDAARPDSSVKEYFVLENFRFL